MLSHLSAAQAAELTVRSFFSNLVGPSFAHGLSLILTFAIVMSLIAAIASAFRGGKYVHEDDESRA